jgi:hypothetical protein
MKGSILIIVLFGCVAVVSLPAFGRRATASSVVAKFGGECHGVPFRPLLLLERLIQKTKQLETSPCNSPFCVGAFAYDLTYTREGGDQGVIANLANRKGTYIQTSERTEKGYFGNWQPS